MRRAYTLMEIILALGILAVIAGVSVPSWRYYQIVSDLDRSSDQVTQALYRARQLAVDNASDAPWGFRVTEGVLFNGRSYAERDASWDESYPLPSSVTPSGLPEVSFSRMEGIPSATGNVILTAVNGLERIIAVMGDGGVIVRDPSGDHLTICHFGASQPKTLKVAESAWPAHREQHGDALGPCPGG